VSSRRLINTDRSRTSELASVGGFNDSTLNKVSNKKMKQATADSIDFLNHDDFELRKPDIKKSSPHALAKISPFKQKRLSQDSQISSQNSQKKTPLKPGL